MPPLGLAAIKEMIRSSWQHSLDEELERQAGAMRRLGFTEDYREGVAAFLEKARAELQGPLTPATLLRFPFVAVSKQPTGEMRGLIISSS